MEIELCFDGGLADDGLIEFYDASRAIVGFQRSLALTAHFVLNGEVITQAPYVSGFEMYAPTFEKGSWKSKALLVFSAGVALTSAGKDSPMGQIVTSVYDYVLQNTMGFHVDYEKTLQELYYEHLHEKGITAERIDSLCEKVESNIADMHRPIVISESAHRAQIHQFDIGTRKIGPDLSFLTYDYVRQTFREEEKNEVIGYVSSYNINTYKGRVFCETEQRPIPFELEERIRSAQFVGIITRSQHLNGQIRFDPRARVRLTVHRLLSANGRVKRLIVTGADSLG